jgi:hypothetical protein
MSKAVSLPLQGFWNMIIFVYDKAYLVRQVDPSTSWWQAVKDVFLYPNEIPLAFLTNLTMVEETRNAGVQEEARPSHEITMSFTMNNTKDEEARNHGDAEPSNVSKDSEDDLIANNLVENVFASKEKNYTNFSHKRLRRAGMLRLKSPSTNSNPPPAASVGSSRLMTGSSISGAKMSYSSRNIESLECSASGAFSDESID